MADQRMTPEYIALCRKLALSREWQEGDWTVSKGGFVALFTTERLGVLPHNADIFHKWLPHEGDWLDLLEAEGEYPALLVSLQPAKDGSGYGIDTAEGDDGDCYFGPDRLTALAKLWCAVKGIDS